ncbi:MAG TPA: hypothetical protein VJ547_05360 [Candidatus Thermoplasmatota archaeon]|nr:hypothetical protein [Candidatus Thermoplasmatota archaeon]
MVNQDFLNNFHTHLQKGLGASLAGQPTVMGGGVEMDHNKGLGSKLKGQVVPFYKESYQATEFLTGWIPLRAPGVPALYFQVAVLNVKGKNIPGVGHFATFVDAPIAETVVSPFVGFGSKYVSMNALTDDQLTAKEALKSKARWTPLLEALNADKPALKAGKPKSESASMGGFEVKVDGLNPMGLTQLAPYKGFTVITRQEAPALWAGVNKPVYNWEATVEQFQLLAGFIGRFPQVGEEEGQQIVTGSNSSMMELLFAHLEQQAMTRPGYQGPSAAESPAMAPSPGYEPTALQPPAPPAMAAESVEKVPCPTCGKPVGVGFKFCPFCRQELVWQ